MSLFPSRLLNGCGGGHTMGSLCVFRDLNESQRNVLDGGDVSAGDQESSTTTTSPHQIIQEVYLLFLAFVVLSTTIYCIWRTRPCCPKEDDAAASGEEADEEDEDLAAAGALTLQEKAGLYRLRRSERKKVMERIVEQRSYKYSPSATRRAGKEEISSCGYKNEKKRDVETGEPTPITNTVSSSTSEDEGKTDDSLAGTNNHLVILDSQEDLCFGEMCCICLTAYQDGDLVMTGSQCSHIFHSQCCQEWLLKQDHCPYCRVETVQASEFRQVAVEVLGKARVEVRSKPMIVLASVEAAAAQLSHRSTPSTTESSARTLRTIGDDVEEQEESTSFNFESGDVAFMRTGPNESDQQHHYPNDEESN